MFENPFTHLVLACNEHRHQGACVIEADDVRAIIPDANDSYGRRALAPMLDELTGAERSYLASMADAMGENHMVKSADVAKAMGREPSSVGRQRETLLNLGIIAVPEYGSLMFAIPLLRRYLQQAPRMDRNIERFIEWGL